MNLDLLTHIKAYHPDQPRDSAGKWTSGGDDDKKDKPTVEEATKKLAATKFRPPRRLAKKLTDDAQKDKYVDYLHAIATTDKGAPEGTPEAFKPSTDTEAEKMDDILDEIGKLDIAGMAAADIKKAIKGAVFPPKKKGWDDDPAAVDAYHRKLFEHYL